MPLPNLDARIKERSASPDTKGCIRWLGAFNIDRQGVWRKPKLTQDRKSVNVCRYLLAKKLGRDIKPGLMALHNCNHEWCINQDHLYEGSKAQNVQDAIAHGTHIKGSRVATSVLNETQAWMILLFRQRGHKVVRIAEIFNVWPRTIYYVLDRTAWRHVEMPVANT